MDTGIKYCEKECETFFNSCLTTVTTSNNKKVRIKLEKECLDILKKCRNNCWKKAENVSQK